jgi:hypothetical protein
MLVWHIFRKKNAKKYSEFTANHLNEKSQAAELAI